MFLAGAFVERERENKIKCCEETRAPRNGFKAMANQETQLLTRVPHYSPRRNVTLSILGAALCIFGFALESVGHIMVQLGISSRSYLESPEAFLYVL